MGISNVGVDIVNIERFRKKEYSKNKKFYEKIFSKSEIQYCLSFKNNYQHFAGKFAIKEAVKKSIKENVSFKEILTKHKNSKPQIILKNLTKISKKYDEIQSNRILSDKEILNIFQNKIQVPKWVASEENSESFNNFLNKLSKAARIFL